jgi:hypothetical protein
MSELTETTITCEGEWRDAPPPQRANLASANYGWSQPILVCSGCSDVMAPNFQQYFDRLLDQYHRGIITLNEYLGQVSLLEYEVLTVRLSRAHMPRSTRKAATP